MKWLGQWDGPEDPIQYLKGLMARATALQGWVEKAQTGSLLTETLDLSELFRPDTFLNALRQQTARELGCSMDSLKFVSSWLGTIADSKLPIKLGGVQLEGCSFDGTRLSESQQDSPSVSSIPPCVVAWVPKDSPDPYGSEETISLPIYFDITRERLVARLDVPCGGSIGVWLRCGAALFLKS
ncbi:Cytoplasmic dynein 2 heavy chain 1 [Nucella lapillus]